LESKEGRRTYSFTSIDLNDVEGEEVINYTTEVRGELYLVGTGGWKSCGVCLYGQHGTSDRPAGAPCDVLIDGAE